MSIREIEDKHRKLLTQRYASGAKLQYRGRWLMLDVQAGDVAEVQVSCRSKFHVVIPEHLVGVERLEAIRPAFDGWLRDRAKRDLLRFGRRHEIGLQVKVPALGCKESLGFMWPRPRHPLGLSPVADRSCESGLPEPESIVGLAIFFAFAGGEANVITHTITARSAEPFSPKRRTDSESAGVWVAETVIQISGW